MKLIALISAILCFLLCRAANDKPSGAPRIVTNSRAKILAKPSTPAAVADFSALTLKTLKQDMPSGGGYGAGRDASANLCKAVTWVEADKLLVVSPDVAKPSFCSGACYLLLVKTLQNWEKSRAGRLSPEAWQQLAVRSQADGTGIWGRANANGPGFSKLVHDLRAGVNFTDLKQARPGDFLKFFWSNEIGAKERGHMVVYLGHEVKNGVLFISYWSANKPDGYSVRRMEASKMHNLIFTRITNPQNFNNVVSLPKADKWLQDMLKKSFSFAEVCQNIGAPAPARTSKK